MLATARRYFTHSILLIFGTGISKLLPLLFGILLIHLYNHEAYDSFVLLMSLCAFVSAIATMGSSINLISATSFDRDGGKAAANISAASMITVCVGIVIACLALFFVPTLRVSTSHPEIYSPFFSYFFLVVYAGGISVMQIAVTQLNHRRATHKAGLATMMVIGSAYGAGVVTAYYGATIEHVLACVGGILVFSTFMLYWRINRKAYRALGFLSLYRQAAASLYHQRADYWLPSVFSIIILLTQYTVLNGVSHANNAIDGSAFSVGVQLFAIGLFVPGILGHVIVPISTLIRDEVAAPVRFISSIECVSLVLYSLIGLVWLALVWLGLDLIVAYYKLPDTQAVRDTICLMQVAALLAAINAVINQKFVTERLFKPLAIFAFVLFITTYAWAFTHGFSTLSASIGFVLGYAVTIVVGGCTWLRMLR